MKIKRIGSAVLSLAMLGQAIAAMPALPAAAAQISDCTLTDFAAMVQEITAADADRDFFSEIVYDEAAGTLTVGGGFHLYFR